MSLERWHGWGWLTCDYADADGACDAETDVYHGPGMSVVDRSDIVAHARRAGWAVREDNGADLCPKHCGGSRG